VSFCGRDVSAEFVSAEKKVKKRQLRLAGQISQAISGIVSGGSQLLLKILKSDWSNFRQWNRQWNRQWSN
jgi:hypothetical protein